MKTIKGLKDGNTLYTKSSILKSFLSEVTLTVTFLLSAKFLKNAFASVLQGNVVFVVMLL